MFLFLSHLIGGAVSNPAILSLLIVLGSCIFEDAAAVIVGVLAADGDVSISIALLSLYAGAAIGNIGLYCIGWLASTHKRLSRYAVHDVTAPVRAWLETRFILTIFSARFIPGLRLPTYTASGFFRSPFLNFVSVATLTTTAWTTVLFLVSYWFGGVTTAHWLRPTRWIVAGAFLVTLFFVGRHNLLAYRARKKELDV